MVMVQIVKWLSVLLGLSAVSGMLPEKVAPIATIVFMVVSSLKDSLVNLGDLIDDGIKNQSFKG